MNDKGGLYSHFIPEEERQEYICDNGISTYPCVRREAYRVTPERKEAVRSLQRIHEREIYGTELYLFGVAGFSVDLREEVLALSPVGPGEIPYARVQGAMVRSLRRTGLYAEVLDKVASFEAPEHVRGFLSNLSIAEALMEASV